MKTRNGWIIATILIATSVSVATSPIIGSPAEAATEARLSEIRLELPNPARFDECNKTCVGCGDGLRHFNVVAPPSSPAGSGGPEHEACEGDHQCECTHDCDALLSCFQLQAEIERAIGLLADATEAEVVAFLASNRHAVLINPARSALQFMGCREGEVVAHIPMDPVSVHLLLSELGYSGS